MKIIISVPSLTSGSGLSRYVLTLCDILNKDHEIAVLTTHESNENTFGETAIHEISPDIKLFKICHSNKLVKYFIALRFIRSYDPDLVINNYNGLIQFILPLLKKKTKVIHVLHNDTDDFYRIGAINANKTSAWIAPTNAIRDHFNEYTDNSYADRVSVISHGVQSGLNHSKESQRLEIVYTGVLYEHKGVKELPEIIKRLLAKGIDLHFTIIGQGILEDWLKDQFVDEYKSGIVEFTGVIDHNEVYKRMSKSDIFLYPTHLDAFGLVIAEAMINGAVPVVTHLKGVTDNLVNNEKDGFLVNKGNIEGFIDTIKNLYDNPEIIRQISQTALKKAESLFSMSVMRSNYEIFLSKAISNKLNT